MKAAPLASTPSALATWRARERAAFEDVFQPAPHMGPSEWAERHRRISQGPAVGQRWSNEMTPYLVEIMDFITSPWCRRGVVMKSARVGFTEGVILNAFGWTVAMDPAPIAIVQPSDDEARDFSKENVTPFLDENPIVRSRLGELGTRSIDSTLTHKVFPGGWLSILGAVSDKNMRRRSYKRLLVDEVDGMKMSAAEGDPLGRFERRTDDYEDDAGVMLVGSTPTRAGSRIDREFRRSDQRKWHVPCPHCGERQVLQWGGPREPFGIKWDKEPVCKSCGVVADDPAATECSSCGAAEFALRHLPETAHYVCEFCGGRIEEDAKDEMILAGGWIATNPLGEIPGWHINALMSRMPAARWPILVSAFLAAKEPEDLQQWWNTVLGLPWEDRTKQVPVATLEARAEEYVDARGEVVDVPDGVGVLTAFVDVQGSWLELLVRGWGVEEESWDILHQRITGEPDLSTPWSILDSFLLRRYRNVHGVELPILCALIDAGAYHDAVCRFVKPRERRNVFGSLGDRTGAPEHPPIKRPSKANAQGARIFTIGTFRLKTQFYNRLALTTPGPRFVHLRAYNEARCNGFDAEYFAQLQSESRVRRRSKGSTQVKELYKKNRERNEGLDLHVGNAAALLAIGGVRENMAAWVEAARRKPEAKKPDVPPPPPPSNWVLAGV